MILHVQYPPISCALVVNAGCCRAAVPSEIISPSLRPIVFFPQPRLVDTEWPAQTVIEPVDETLGLPVEASKEKGQPVSGLIEIEPVSGENQEGRGQQGFEGPEKTLEIEFNPEIGHEKGLRAIRREQWDAILEQVRVHSNGICVLTAEQQYAGVVRRLYRVLVAPCVAN